MKVVEQHIHHQSLRRSATIAESRVRQILLGQKVSKMEWKHHTVKTLDGSEAPVYINLDKN